MTPEVKIENVFVEDCDLNLHKKIATSTDGTTAFVTRTSREPFTGALPVTDQTCWPYHPTRSLIDLSEDLQELAKNPSLAFADSHLTCTAFLCDKNKAYKPRPSRAAAALVAMNEMSVTER